MYRIYLETELDWEGKCIEAAAMHKRDGKLYMFYAGAYNNEPQQSAVLIAKMVFGGSGCSRNHFFRVDRWEAGMKVNQGIPFSSRMRMAARICSFKGITTEEKRGISLK